MQQTNIVAVAVNRLRLEKRRRDRDIDDVVGATDIRMEMKGRLPFWLQPFLTWLTGKPYAGQKPLLNVRWGGHELIALGLLFSGSMWVALTIALAWLHSAAFFSMALPLTILSVSFGWLLTVSGARKLLVTCNHQAIHGQFTGSPWLDRLLAELHSILVLVQPFEQYRKEHKHDHHGKDFTTIWDPDCRFLVLVLCFEPGNSVLNYWRRLLLTCFSPRFHWVFLRARLAANLWNHETPLWRRVYAWLSYLGLVTVVVVASLTTNSFLPAIGFLVGWVVPLTVFYQVSALLQFTSEHFWLARRDRDEAGRIDPRQLSLVRLNGEAPPPQHLPWWQQPFAWARWIVRMALIHFPCRVGVICTDLPAHPWHHAHALSKSWTVAAYAMQREMEAGIEYRISWSLFDAINQVFEHLSQQPPLTARERARLSREDVAKVVHGM